MSFIVYVHTAPNGKRYVGITTQALSRRWRDGGGYINNGHFHKAIVKYGWESFTHEIIECSSEEEMKSKEQELIALYDTTNPDKGYNHTFGGEMNIPGDSTRENMSIAQKKRFEDPTNHHMYGKHHSDETKRKIAEAEKGKTMSVEARQKMSLAGKGKPKSEQWKAHASAGQKKRFEDPEERRKQSLRAKGRPCSEATRKKLSEVHKKKYREGRIPPNLGKFGATASGAKSVLQFSLDGKLIQEWGSVMDASKALNITHSCICNVCAGRKRSASGFVWKYKEKVKDGNI